MKSTDNRYRPPRIRFNLEDWTKKKPNTGNTNIPQFGKQALGFGRKKKGKA